MSYIYLVFRRETKRVLMLAGFGLIELMVSISIMALIMGIVFTRQDSFNGTILLRNQAYEVALRLREVQLSSVSVVGFGGDYRTVQGAHFSVNSGEQGGYIIFQDLNSNYYFNNGEQIGQQGAIDPRFRIEAIRAVGDTISGGEISVVFERPDFDARFFDSNGEVNASSIEIDIAQINSGDTELTSIRTVEVTSAGQIAVQ
jgi:prepilin-type N-terminal cleavage/methylation domain-containing protein